MGKTAGQTKYITYSGGASGDWTCDGTADQVEINAALSWANANPGNIIKMRGPHTYNITGQIKYGSSTVWTAEAGVILKIPNGACGTNRSDCVFPDGKPVIINLTTPVTGIEIYGFEIDGNCQNQSTVLGLVHGTTVKSAGSGVERLIGVYGSKASQYHHKDVHIHDMVFHDAFGEAVHARYCENIRVHDCDCRNHQHDAIFFLACSGEGNKIYDNYIEAISDGAIRLDSCQNVKVYGNECTTYSGPNNNGTAEHGDNGMQIANNGSYDILTSNIEVFNNTFTNHGLCGIWINDVKGTAGTSAQTVTIWNNTFTGCGNPGNSGKPYSGCISIYPWGNGVTIKNNTFNANYSNAINVLTSIVNAAKVYITNNNFVSQKGEAQSGTSLSQIGYAIVNVTPSAKKMSVVAEGNYCSGNLQSSNYYGVTPISTSSTPNGNLSDSSGGTTTDDDEVTPDDTTGSVYIQPIRILQEELDNYYIPGRTAYINGVPFRWSEKKVDVDRSVGQEKCPGMFGWSLTDFNWAGAIITLDGFAYSEDDVDEIMAAFNQEGRSTLEFGGVDDGYLVYGICTNFATELRLNSMIPAKAYPFSVKFMLDEPYRRSTTQKIRSKYVYGNLQWAADDCYAGNLLKNPSFENWTANTEMDWDNETCPEYSLRSICYSEDVELYCAVSSDGHIITSSGSGTWAEQTAPSYTYWGVAAGHVIETSGYPVTTSEEYPIEFEDGYNLAVSEFGYTTSIFVACGDSALATSPDGEDWTERTVPAMAWRAPIYSKDLNRWGVLASAGSGNRAIYSIDGGATWKEAAILDNSYSWISVDWSPVLHLFCAVSYDGHCATSPDFQVWTAVTIPSQKWTSVKWCETCFIAVSEDGTQQAAYTEDAVTWTLMDTPYSSSSTSSGGATATAQDPKITPTGSNYSSPADEYTDSTSYQITHTLAARTDGSRYRIDQVSGSIRAYSASYVGYLRVTATIGSGTETQIAEWQNNTATFINKTQDLALEGGTNEQILIKYYLKTTNTSYRAYGTLFKVNYSVISSSGTSSISYTRNMWQGLAYDPNNNMAVAVGKLGTLDRVMFSMDKLTWTLAEASLAENIMSVCYGDNRFVAVASSGSSRIMSSTGLGSYMDTPPLNWTLGSRGFYRSNDIAHDGDYGIVITGDGSTAERGMQYQPVKFESGTSYILSGWGKTEGLTNGTLRADIVSNGVVIKELIWDSSYQDWTQKQIRVRFDVAPNDTIVRFRGAGTPNDGALLYIDDLLVQKASDFEIGITGKDIATTGTVNVVPDVQIRGVSATSSPIATEKADSKGSTTVYSSAATAYSTENTSLEWTCTLAAESGVTYRVDKVSALLKSGAAGRTGYLKVTYKIGSGAETQLVEWTDTTGVFTPKSQATTISGSTITLYFYMKTSYASARAYGDDFLVNFTRLTNSASTGTISGKLSIYNTQDTANVLDCCDSIFPGATLEIKADYTGSYRVAVDFLDDSFLDYCYSKSGVTYNAENKTLVIASGGSLILPMCDVKYPVTGTPFVDCYVKSGIPQFSIAVVTDDNIPGTFYPTIWNTSTSVTDTEIYRELVNTDNLVLTSKTRYFIKIEPYSGSSCEFGSFFHYADIVTIDAVRPLIFKGGEPNIFGAYTDGKSSIIVTLKYRDSHFVR